MIYNTKYNDIILTQESKIEKIINLNNYNKKYEYNVS